ncbi:chromate resistance protein [Actinoplanes sp. NBC_00393]|uniref:Chromate resistance protein ChrB n=1 Tax=Actinoplanes sp. NBC_00393 TaxID=2975953 RepID=UPI002E1E7823
MDKPGQWVLLAYRMPREPSRPRIAVWRKLERLGVARLGDGLVALPADARTREQLDWLADEIGEADGSATVWLATASTLAQEQQIAAGMQQARADEYRAVIDEAAAARDGSHADQARALRRLRSELHRIGRRDFFPPREREAARAAVQTLAEPDPADIAKPSDPAEIANWEQS